MTNKEIAKQLGISPAALSLIINNKPGVSDTTRAAVISRLQEMGYEHLIKRKPVSSENNITFIVYKRHGLVLSVHPFFMNLIEQVGENARRYGYNMYIATIDKRAPLEQQVDAVNQQGTKGAIIFGTEMYEDDLELLAGLTMPYVIMDNAFSLQNCSTVAINNRMGTWQAVSYLRDCGRRRIGYLRCSTRISSFDERHEGFERALQEAGLTLRDEDIWTLPFTEEESYRSCQAYLDRKDLTLPEAFVTDDDLIAMGVMRALAERGWQIPRDISLIGFSDRPLCNATSPTLTSVALSNDQLSAASVDELARLIQSNEAGETITYRKIRIPTYLEKRKSVMEP